MSLLLLSLGLHWATREVALRASRCDIGSPMPASRAARGGWRRDAPARIMHSAGTTRPAIGQRDDSADQSTTKKLMRTRLAYFPENRHSKRNLRTFYVWRPPWNYFAATDCVRSRKNCGIATDTDVYRIDAHESRSIWRRRCYTSL